MTCAEPVIDDTATHFGIVVLVRPHRLDVLMAHRIAYRKNISGLSYPHGAEDMTPRVEKNLVGDASLATSVPKDSLGRVQMSSAGLGRGEDPPLGQPMTPKAETSEKPIAEGHPAFGPLALSTGDEEPLALPVQILYPRRDWFTGSHPCIMHEKEDVDDRLPRCADAAVLHRVLQ